MANFAQNQALTTGKCLTIKVTSDKDNSVEPKEVDCSDKSQYSWEVAQVTTAQSLCPADTEYAIELTRSSRRSGKTTTEKVACLIPNLHQDVCYAKQQGQRRRTSQGGGLLHGGHQGHQTRREHF